MKLKELIENLQEVEKKYGGNIDVIYATDDEGNGFNDIFSAPTLVKRLTDNSYMSDEDLEMDIPKHKPNAVIIN